VLLDRDRFLSGPFVEVDACLRGHDGELPFQAKRARLAGKADLPRGENVLALQTRVAAKRGDRHATLLP